MPMKKSQLQTLLMNTLAWTNPTSGSSWAVDCGPWRGGLGTSHTHTFTGENQRLGRETLPCI